MAPKSNRPAGLLDVQPGGRTGPVIASGLRPGDQTGLTSLLLHYPPSYEHEKTMQSLRLFAERVMPAFRPPPRREAGV